MKNEDELREELRSIAPDFPEKQTPSYPEGYFDSFPDKVLTRWKQEPTLQRQILPWQKMAGMAALVAGLLLGVFWLISQDNQQQSVEITALEAYQYIHEHIDEFDELIETEKLTEDVQPLDIPQEDIEEFLMEELNEADVEELF